MGVKMALKRYVKTTYLSFKNLKLYYIVPLLFMYMIVPLINYTEIKIYGFGDNLYENILETAQKFLPLFAAWWVIFILREYVEDEGNEVLYVYENMGKTKVFDVLLIFFIYSLHIVPLFLMYTFFLDNMPMEMIKIIIQSFFFSSLAYCLMYLFRSSAITFMIVMIYNFLVTFYNERAFIENISIFDSTKMSLDLLLQKYVLICCLGIVFLMIGMWKNKTFYK